MLLSIDPGISTGWAEWVDVNGGLLYQCGVGDPRVKFRDACPDMVVIEKPQVYVASRSKGDPNDLITLAIRVGEYKDRFEQMGRVVHLVLPADWKAQVPKPVCHARIYGKLTPDEQEIVGVGGRGLNQKALGDMMDAVGIGLFWLKRCRVGVT